MRLLCLSKSGLLVLENGSRRLPTSEVVRNVTGSLVLIVAFAPLRSTDFVNSWRAGSKDERPIWYSNSGKIRKR